MTLPDPGLDRQVAGPEHVQDEIPATERNQDVGRTSVGHGLISEGSRPLTKEEREAAEHDTPVAERVYAPASERVPRAPLPGHRDMVEHTDSATPERLADTSSAEPTFTRVARPSATLGVETPTPSPYASSMSNPGFSTPGEADNDWRSWDRRMLGAGSIGSLLMMGGIGLGVWLYLRWQHERNKPINRLRRQAATFRKRAPSGSDVSQPIMGLTAALASAAVVLMKQLGSQRQAAAHTISEADWQQRLLQLKERWGTSLTSHR